MSVYQTVLPDVFPYCITETHDLVKRMIDRLMDHGRPDAPDGSSFAVTVDAQPGKWNLWLSDVSYIYLFGESVNYVP